MSRLSGYLIYPRAFESKGEPFLLLAFFLLLLMNDIVQASDVSLKLYPFSKDCFYEETKQVTN